MRFSAVLRLVAINLWTWAEIFEVRVEIVNHIFGRVSSPICRMQFDFIQQKVRLKTLWLSPNSCWNLFQASFYH